MQGVRLETSSCVMSANVDRLSSSGFASPAPSAGVRVLHVNSGNLYGGVETILATLARLKSMCPDMESHFVLCQEGRLSEQLRAAQVPLDLVGAVRLSRPWTVRAARQRFREVLGRQAFDLVICHMPWSLTVFGKVVREAGVPLGFFAHGFHEGRNWLERWARHTEPDMAIANSRYTAVGVANLFANIPVEVVYPPVELVQIAEPSRVRSEVRAEEGVPDDTVVILQVSRLEAWKGHRWHLQALSRLRDRKDWTCWFVGGPQKEDEREYLKELQETAARLEISDRVRFLGQRTDVPRLAAAADVFCQPNQEPEPFGLVFVEAMWAGLPVVTAAMGGALELIDESCGLLVETGDVAGLSGALQKLIESSSLRQGLGSGGRLRAARLCDPSVQLHALSNVAQNAKRSGRRP